VVEVDAQRTAIVQNVVKEGALHNSAAVEVKGEVTARTVADTRRTLDLKAGALADGSLTVTVSPEGYLQGVNSTIEGKTGAVLSNVFQVVGRILGALVLIGARSTTDPPDTIEQPPAVPCTPTGLPKALEREAFLDNRPSRFFFGADTTGVFFVTHSAAGCAAWKDQLVASFNVREQARRVQREEAALKGTATSAQAKDIEERIHRATTVLRRFQTTETEKVAAYDAALTKFKTDNKMTPEKTTIAMRESFAIREIPPLGLVTKLSKLDSESLQGALRDYPRMVNMLPVGTFLTVIDSDASAASNPSTDAVNNAPAKGTTPPGNPANGTPSLTPCADGIAYREPIAVRLAVFQEDDKGKIFKKKDEKVITAFTEAIGCVQIERSNVANRALVMEFGEFGVPKKLARTNTSSAAAATAAVGTALASLQDTYAASLEKVIAIQTSRRTIAQSDLADQIARLTKQKELLDAQIAFEGAAAGKDLLLDQKLAEQRLALLQKQLELSKTEQGAATQLEIAGLKDRIALLEQQLALLLAQRKLDEANRQP